MKYYILTQLAYSNYISQSCILLYRLYTCNDNFGEHKTYYLYNPESLNVFADRYIFNIKDVTFVSEGDNVDMVKYIEILSTLKEPNLDFISYSIENQRSLPNLLNYLKLHYQRVVKDLNFSHFYENTNTDTSMIKKNIIEYFGADKVDFTDNDFPQKVIIYFPEKIVENSNGKFHKIYDIYLKIQISKNSICYIDSYYNTVLPSFNIGIIGLTRTRLSPIEYNKGYHFSHTSIGNGSDWKVCCLGNGILNTLVRKSISLEEEILGFCVALDTYLEWESIEGVPYIYFSKLNDVVSGHYLSLPNTSTVLKNTIHSLCHIKPNIVNHINIATNSVSLIRENIEQCSLYFTLDNNYITTNFIKSHIDKNSKSENSKKEIKGSNFFQFKGSYIGAITVDHSLATNSSLNITHCRVGRHVLPNVITFLSNTFESILNDTKKRTSCYTSEV